MLHFMKKQFTIFLFFLSLSTFAQDNKKDSLIFKLSNKIAVAQFYFNHLIYPEIAFIRDEYNVPNLLKNDSLFIKRLNDIYYKRFYPYGKMLNREFIITEDCIVGDVNEKLLDAYKLHLYSLYDNIKLPNDFFKRLETSSKEDDPFLSPYYALNTIYYLKKFHKNLNTSQKTQLKSIEQNLSTLLYNNYVVDKPWSFRKILAVKVLKINKNKNVDNIDLSELIDYYLTQGLPKSNILDIQPFTVDTKDQFLLKNIGMDKVLQLQAVSVLWIILNEK